METCLSTLALERLDAGALKGRELAQARAHVSSCPRCSRRSLEMDEEAAAFRRSPRALTARAAFGAAERRQRMRWTAFAAVAVAAGLAVVPAARLLRTTSPARSTPLHARAVPPTYLEPRGGDAPVRLRQVSIRGQPVAFGEGVLEGVGASAHGPLTLRHTDVVGEVSGFVERVTVTQEFANPFAEPIDAVYAFPLPPDAAVDEMTLSVGERVIQGVVKRRDEARRSYEEAKSLGRHAALLDQERPNIFTQSVANVRPGEALKVTLRYVAPLAYDDGTFEINFPMVVGPRYVPGAPLGGESQGTGTVPDTDRVTDASRITPPVLPASSRSGRDITATFRIDAGFRIEGLESISHRLRLARPSDEEADVVLDATDRLPNKDLIIRFRVAGPELRSAVLAHAGERGRYFALMVQPEEERVQPPPAPRELVLLLDTSCSMSGAPIAAAKNAARRALLGMNRGDTFELIDFADSVSTFSSLPLANTPQNVDRALGYLDRLPASGGTNQLDGIRAALTFPADPERVRMVLLLTDGFIGNEDEIFGETQRLLGGARIFSMGIGTSVNHYFLSRLAELGRGFYQYVRPDEDSSKAIERFERRIARPLLTDVTIDWGGLQVEDVLPRRVPDLFDHQPFILVGRALGSGTGMVRVTGRSGGSTRTTTVRVTLPEREELNGALASMWARARVEELEQQQYGRERSEIAAQIATVGLEYQLVTRYTSFVAVEQEGHSTPSQSTVVVGSAPPEKTEFGKDPSTYRLQGLIGKAQPVLTPQGHGVLRGGWAGGGSGAPTHMVHGHMSTPEYDEQHEADTGQEGGVDGSAVGDVGGIVGGRVDGWDHGSGARAHRPAKEPSADGDDDFAKTFGGGGAPKGGGKGEGKAARYDFSGVDVPGRNGLEHKSAVKEELKDDNFARTFGSGGSAKKVARLELPVSKDVYIPPAPGSGGDITDQVSQGDITATVVSNKPAIVACVKQQKAKDPNLSGTIVLRWVIELNGRTSHVTIVSDDYKNSPIGQCLIGLIKSWNFPRHKQPQDPVNFPFKF